MPGRLVIAVASMAFVTLASACSGGGDDGTSPSSPDVEMSFSQHRIDEGSARANLRVVNNGDEPAEVTEIGLDSAGYGNHLEDHRTTIPPGQTIDLRMTLPEPVCDDEPVPAYGLATIDGRAVRERLDRFGEAFVESLWRRRCNQLAVTSVADLAWRFDFDAVGTGRESYLEGALDLDRVPGTTATLQVRGMQGSVLFRLMPTARPVLTADAASVSVPLRLAWGRCDAHAIGESSQTFLWKLDVSVDGAAPVRITSTVADEDKAPLLAYLKDACG